MSTPDAADAPLWHCHTMTTTCRPCGHVTTAPMYDARPAAMPADYGTLRLAPKGAETCACGARVTQTELQAPAYFIAQLKAQMQVAQ